MPIRNPRPTAPQPQQPARPQPPRPQPPRPQPPRPQPPRPQPPRPQPPRPQPPRPQPPRPQPPRPQPPRPQPPRPQPPRPQMPGLPAKPTNVADLQNLLTQYGALLNPENKQFIQELIENLQQGGDQKSLVDLAARMQQAAAKQQNKGQQS